MQALIICLAWLLILKSPAQATEIGCCIDVREIQTCLNLVSIECTQETGICSCMVQCTKFVPVKAICIQDTFETCFEAGWLPVSCAALFCVYPAPHCADEQAVTNHAACPPTYPILPPFVCGGSEQWDTPPGDVCRLEEPAQSPWCGDCYQASRETGEGEFCVEV